MFSQTTEYVLRVVVYLASRGRLPSTTRQIAQATKVPEGYLSKLLQNLIRAGLVAAKRGLHGGSVLTRPANELSVLEVIETVEPMQRIRTCPLGHKSHAGLCPLHRRIDQAMAGVEKAFRESTIAELLAESTNCPPLCEGPSR